MEVVENHIDEKQRASDESVEISELRSDSSELSILDLEFPLKHKWKFWYLDGEKHKDWMLRLHDVCVLSSVEDFWALIDRIRKPSSMPACDYSLFKENISPVWEEPENKNGGRVVFQGSKGSDSDTFNELWLKLMLGMIGDWFGEYTTAICGAVCSSRTKGSKISIWTTNASDSDSITQIGIRMRDLWATQFDNMERAKIFFESHADAQVKMSSLTTHRMTITGGEGFTNNFGS